EGRDRGESEDSGDQHAPPVHLPVPERPLYIESRNTCTGSMPNTTYLASCGGPLSVAIRTVKTRPGASPSGSSERISYSLSFCPALQSGSSARTFGFLVPGTSPGFSPSFQARSPLSRAARAASGGGLKSDSFFFVQPAAARSAAALRINAV